MKSDRSAGFDSADGHPGIGRGAHLLLAQVILLSLSLAGGFACGDATPEQRLDSAEATLSNAIDDAEGARASLAAARNRVDAVESELHEAREEMRAAEKRVISAAERLERRATDTALFRAIQRQLLDAEALERDAVRVGVEDGRVTLSGAVTSDDARETALRIARTTSGVASVRDRLSVESRDTEE